MTFALATACAVLPSLLLLGYFYKKDAHPEPRHVLLITFVLGVLTVVPVLVLGNAALLVLRPLSDPFLGSLFLAFGLAAGPEEFFKFLVVVCYCMRHREFDEPMDGIVYGAAASLGFATYENIRYVTEGGLATAAARALTSVPSHAFVGAIMGYFVARARFGPREERAWNLFQALFVPILLHGLYDFPLIYAWLESPGGDDSDVSGFALALLIVPFVVLLIEAFVTVRLVRRLRALQLVLKERQARSVGVL